MPKVKLSELFYVGESPIHGKGLFARCEIKEGQPLGTYRGPACHDLDAGGPHVLWVESESGVWVGRDGRNILRYMNHNNSPCAEFDGFELFAITDIARDSEITIHYGEEFVADIAEEG
jgi:SET domain-containing protein